MKVSKIPTSLRLTLGLALILSAALILPSASAEVDVPYANVTQQLELKVRAEHMLHERGTLNADLIHEIS